MGSIAISMYTGTLFELTGLFWNIKWKNIVQSHRHLKSPEVVANGCQK